MKEQSMHKVHGKAVPLGATYFSANDFPLGVKRTSATHQVLGEDMVTVRNEQTTCTEHTKASLDFAKASSKQL